MTRNKPVRNFVEVTSLRLNKDSFTALGDSIERLQEILQQPPTRSNIDSAMRRFRLCFELFWKILKKEIMYLGEQVYSPRDTLQKAYQFHLIDDDQIWLEMLKDRNETSHTYEEGLANLIYEDIKDYIHVFEQTYEKLRKLRT